MPDINFNVGLLKKISEYLKYLILVNLIYFRGLYLTKTNGNYQTDFDNTKSLVFYRIIINL